MRRLSTDLAASLRNPEFWALSSWLDVVVRYRQSRLGIFWLVAPAIVYIWGLGGSFARMMGTSPLQFAAHVGLGYLVFRVISTVMTESTTAFAASSQAVYSCSLTTLTAIGMKAWSRPQSCEHWP